MNFDFRLKQLTYNDFSVCLPKGSKLKNQSVPLRTMFWIDSVLFFPAYKEQSNSKKQYCPGNYQQFHGKLFICQ